jgi:hypothetical protein
LVLIKASYYPKSIFVGIIMLGYSLKMKTYNALKDDKYDGAYQLFASMHTCWNKEH